MKHMIAPDIETYAEAHSMPESDVCRQLREATWRSVELPQMMVGPLEGALLKMMTHMVAAKRVLEIGTFTGYSALCFAEALPEDGTVLTCDSNAETTEWAKRYWAKSPVGNKIASRLGPALETLQTVEGLFDVIFIDADKINYVQYYRRGVELLSPAGVMLIDNVLWSGKVIEAPPPDDDTAAIRAVNRVVADDARVTAVLLTVRDGVLVIRHNRPTPHEARRASLHARA